MTGPRKRLAPRHTLAVLLVVGLTGGVAVRAGPLAAQTDTAAARSAAESAGTARSGSGSRELKAGLFGAFLGAAAAGGIAYAVLYEEESCSTPPCEPSSGPSIGSETWSAAVVGGLVGGTLGIIIGRLTDPDRVRVRGGAGADGSVELGVRLVR